MEWLRSVSRWNRFRLRYLAGEDPEVRSQKSEFSYCTASVTTGIEIADPMRTWIGTAAPGDSPDGTCALI